MNKHAISTDTKPDWVKSKSIQAQDDIDKQANELLGSIMSELKSPSEKKSSTTVLSGETNPSDAMTMVSKLLVHRLIPHLTEHFRPPSPPGKKEVATMKRQIKNPYLSGSSFNDFRKAGILKSSDNPLSSDTPNDSKEESILAEKLNDIAGRIVTAAVKDDRINNVRKQDEIQALVNDLALGIVSNVLDNESKRSHYSSSHEGRLFKGQQAQLQKLKGATTNKAQTSSTVLLQRALYAKTNAQKYTNNQIDRLADSIVNGMQEKDSGSSRISSGKAHGESSEFEALSKVVINTVPKVYTVSNTEDDLEDLIAEKVVPTSGTEYQESVSAGSQFITDVVGKAIGQGEAQARESDSSALAEITVSRSIAQGQIPISSKSGASDIASELVAQLSLEDATKSGKSSLAERLVQAGIDGCAATETSLTDFAESMVTKSMLVGQETGTSLSGLAEQVIQPSMVTAQDTKSGGSSLAEIFVTETFNAPSEKSGASSIAELIIAEGALDAEDDVISAGSSLAELQVAQSMVGGEVKALSKSPTSSLAEDMVKNIDELEPTDYSQVSSLAGDIIKHTMDDVQMEQ